MKVSAVREIQAARSCLLGKISIKINGNTVQKPSSFPFSQAVLLGKQTSNAEETFLCLPHCSNYDM